MRSSPAAPSPHGDDVRPVAGLPTVAVVGGGQLARMMAPPATALGVRLRVLVTACADPAAQVVPDAVPGHHEDLDALRRLAVGADVVTFDHEHVPQDHLLELEREGTVVHPGSGALRHAQDKLVMRARLADLGVPQPRWRAVGDVAALRAFGNDVGWPVVLKTPRGGYDGKGVQVVRSPGEAAGVDWFEGRDGDPLLAEEHVDFVRELAVLLARSPSGQAAAWPVVETLQVDGVCREVTAPAPGLRADDAATATATGLRVAAALEVTGVMAVEMFQARDGRLLVNELAMRPHNSGHWSIDGAVTSQFEQHLRAVLDLPLGDPRPRAPWTVMVNVLGGDHEDLYRSYLHVMARDPGAKVHLYGKEVRPGRKVGHVTVCGDDLDDVRARARHAADFITGLVDE